MQIELNAETRWILGRPNFACGKLAERLRELWYDIGPSAEWEQAAAIHWMLNLYLAHGAEWMEVAETILAPSAVTRQLDNPERVAANG